MSCLGVHFAITAEEASALVPLPKSAMCCPRQTNDVTHYATSRP